MDSVAQPSHYQGSVECIDAIRAALGDVLFIGYCRVSRRRIMTNPIDEDFVGYCRGLTGKQLEEVLSLEYAAYQHRDYASAVVAAKERGWTVRAGKRID